MCISVAPNVELSLGRMVNPEDLEEGDDIYFSCSIKANPPAYKITWWHNVCGNHCYRTVILGDRLKKLKL